MWNANGILIQGINDKTDYVKHFPYQGMNAYFQYPLAGFYDSECRKLTNEQQSKLVSENEYQSLEFISNFSLFARYLKRCRELRVEIRALFVESEYSDEIWSDDLPEMCFLGYEYCPIPIDEQIITDLDWYAPFSYHLEKLNKQGLFSSYADALDFAKEYHKAETDKKIGDGEIDAFICRVYQVVL